MKRITILVAALCALTAPVLAVAAMEHGGHGSMTMGDGGHAGSVAHEEVVDGVKATFTIQTMKDAMKAMGMELPKGMKETHHIAVAFKDAKSGKALTEGEVKLKLQDPGQNEQTKDLSGMHGHFGADFTLAKPGKYGIMCKYKLADGKVRSAKFWYTVK